MQNKVELLAPAGDLEKLKFAIYYGADAVYLGGEKFSLRAQSNRMTLEKMQEAVSFVHEHGKKIFITVNIFAHNQDFEELPDYLKVLEKMNVDAVLIADPGVFSLAKKIAPNLNLHISTQANTTNLESVKFWHDLGAERIVLARELSFEEILKIRRTYPEIPLEIFVHGALCMSYSGRCFISQYLTGRDANHGSCVQACRFKYALQEETRPNEFFPIEEDARGSYFFSSKDLCLLPLLKKILQNNLVDSLKIEGRNKSVAYVASVVKVYREAVDLFYADPENFKILPHWLDELEKFSHREYTTGFFGKEKNLQIEDETKHRTQMVDFVGVVLDYDEEKKLAKVEQRNNLKRNASIEFLQPKAKNFSQTLEEMFDENFVLVDVVPHAQQIFYIKTNQPVEKFSIVRRLL